MFRQLNTHTINEGLAQCYTHLRTEITAIREGIDKMPYAARTQAVNTLVRYVETQQLLELAAEHVSEVEAAYKEMQKRVDLATRWQIHWRVLAVKVALGRAGVEGITHQSFLQLITEPPPEEKLRAELAELVKELERLEQVTEEHGPLRSIQIDRMR